MARIEIDPNYSSPTFPRATAATDLFKKEDVQALAAALSTHDHSTGKGVVLGAGSIPAGSITSAMIADGTIQVGDIADGAVTSAKILDGTIATGDLANNAVTNAKLGTDTARANLLVNGSFEIWQRGNGPFTANGAYTADRWAIDLGGGSSISVTKTGTVDTSSLGALNAVYTHSVGSHLYQKIEDYGQLAGRTISLSMRVRTSTANAVRLTIYDSTNSWRYGAFHSGGGTYETLTLTLAIPAGVTIVQIGVDLEASTTFQLDNAMLVVGSVAADYAPLHPADDLARCLRYYEKIGDANTNAIVAGYNAAGGAIYNTFFYTKKAVNPTLTKVGTWTTVNCGQPSAFAVGDNGSCVMTATITATGAGFASAGAAGQLLTIEANP